MVRFQPLGCYCSAMEGSTFRNARAAVRSVFRIKPATTPASDPYRWQTLLGIVLRALSRFPDAYRAVTEALAALEASPPGAQKKIFTDEPEPVGLRC